jgi:acetolactate synthase I/II/III large subunit
MRLRRLLADLTVGKRWLPAGSRLTITLDEEDEMRLADYVIQRVAHLGVKHVFTVPGGGAMHLDDALGASGEVGFVCNLHEQACAIAAEAYARVTNVLGVALVTSGPGGTNALTGVAGAWLESTPCLIISGQVKRADLMGDSGVRQLGSQEVDIVSLAKPITKYAVTVMDPEAIRYHFEKAVFLATTGRPGPVWLDIPLDVQATDIEPSSLHGFDAPLRPEAEADGERLARQVAETVEFLNAAERPVLLVGNGVRLAGAQDAFLEAVGFLGIPVLTTWMGADLLWEDHPLFFGKPGTVASRGANFTLQNADLLLSIGARLDFAVTGYAQEQCARAARKIVVDVDATEIGKLRLHVDVPVCADALDFLTGLLAGAARLRPKDRSEWMAHCRAWKANFPVVLPEYREQTDSVNTYVFASVLADELTADDLIIPGSSGVGIDTFWLTFRVKRGQRLFSTGGLGAMGFGLPASIGGCLASGGKRTVSVDGDGGFQLNIQELATVQRLGLPIKYFVLNNQGYASIRSMQRNHFDGRLMGCDASSGLGLPALTEVGAAYGLAVSRITDHAHLRDGIKGVLERPGPELCEVVVAPDQSVGPRVSSAVRADGTMSSRPLEDLWPFLEREELRGNMLIPTIDDDGEFGGRP